MIFHSRIDVDDKLYLKKKPQPPISKIIFTKMEID